MEETLEDKLPKKITKKNLRVGQPLVAQKMYFYEKPNGEIFECRAREASDAHKKFKQIGVSDGTVSARIVSALQINYKKMTVKQIQTEYRRAFQEELKAARGHFETPPDYTLNTLGNNELAQRMGKRFIGR